MQGRSRLDREEGEHSYLSGNLLYGDTQARALRQGRWKSMVIDETTRLFDLQDDPVELHDVGSREPDLLRALTPANSSTRQGVPVQLSEEEQEALRALGYLE